MDYMKDLEKGGSDLTQSVLGMESRIAEGAQQQVRRDKKGREVMSLW